MKSQGYTPTKLTEMNYLFVIKLVDWKQEQFTIYEVVEESYNSKEFIIRARNNFLSYSNCTLV